MLKFKTISTVGLLLITIIFLSSFSQNNKSEWSKYKEIDNVIIYSKIINCNTKHNTANNEYIVFKYVNNNNYNIRISWKLDVWYNEICRSCDLDSPNEYEISLDIAAGQELEYVCSDDNKAFMIFKSSNKSNMYPNVRYEFNNLSVTKL
jgi:hypothetical protein